MGQATATSMTRDAATSAKKSTNKPKTKSASPKKSSSPKKAADRSGADWDAAKDILAAHRTLARAERRESDIASGLKTQSRKLKALRKESAALSESLSAAGKDLKTARSARQKVAKKLHKLESAAPVRKH